MQARFSEALQQLGPFSSAPHLAVALSGGADSMALALLTYEWLQAHGGRMTALTVDHGLRAESRDEAQQVAAWMRARGIDHHLLTPVHTDASNNLQEAARQWRYDALAEYCRAQGILNCLVAHNAGDNRETAMLHLARGETADGGSGMSAARNYRGVRFLRPFLGFARADLEAYLQQNAAAWIEDPSNKNPRFARVKIRAQLAENAAANAALDTAITTAASARVARDSALAKAAMRLVHIHPLGFAEMDLEGWCTLDEKLSSQLLADCIRTISGSTQRPRAHETARLAAALHGDFRKRTLQHCEVSLRGTHIRIAREASRVAAPLTLSGSGEARWDQRFTIRYTLPPRMHLTLQALGPTGRRQLRPIADLPPATPALWHLDELAFVPHMEATLPALPEGACVRIGFTPAKPLAAAPFWCLNQ